MRGAFYRENSWGRFVFAQKPAAMGVAFASPSPSMDSASSNEPDELEATFEVGVGRTTFFLKTSVGDTLEDAAAHVFDKVQADLIADSKGSNFQLKRLKELCCSRHTALLWEKMLGRYRDAFPPGCKLPDKPAFFVDAVGLNPWGGLALYEPTINHPPTTGRARGAARFALAIVRPRVTQSQWRHMDTLSVDDRRLFYRTLTDAHRHDPRWQARLQPGSGSILAVKSAHVPAQVDCRAAAAPLRDATSPLSSAEASGCKDDEAPRIDSEVALDWGSPVEGLRRRRRPAGAGDTLEGKFELSAEHCGIMVP